MQIEFELNWNSNLTKFNSTIKLRFNWVEFEFNWRKVGCKLVGKNIENLLVNMVLEKELLQNTNTKRQNSMPLYLEMG